jgi:hypothetical protein
LSDGTVVEVEPVADVPSGEPRRGSAQAILRHAGTWAGNAAEIDQLLEALRQMKQAEVRAKKAILLRQDAGKKSGRRPATQRRKPRG